MDYVQMTLDDWIEIKQRLKQELLGVTQSFVRIGYTLRQIDDQKLYERDGYKSVAEFAEKEYGLSHTTTSRFMSINREYSIDGYSDRLRPEYVNMGRSQLEEMLKLPESDRVMIRPETSREDIRELKRFNKTDPAAGVADSLDELIVKFYEDDPDTLNGLFALDDPEDVTGAKEVINPAGNRTYRKGLYFMAMYEDRIMVKQFGSQPQDISWPDFLARTVSIFADAAAGSRTWKNYFGAGGDPEENTLEITDDADIGTPASAAAEEAAGESLPPEEKKELEAEEKETEEETKPDVEKKDSGRPSEDPGTTRRKKLRRRQKTTETLNEAVSEEGGNEEKIQDPEILEKPFGSRKDWMDTLTAYGMACELAQKAKRMLNDSLADMTEADWWESWLKEEVDDHGRTINAGK